ncbi:group 3 secretory phospholipase A2 [Salminus brasiliensis]|uniref:group 3 secretory phospholipase A2 n=1 Tax=Salminus brasiliensis TaxID=930266 RepID=UPI003B83A55B
MNASCLFQAAGCLILLFLHFASAGHFQTFADSSTFCFWTKSISNGHTHYMFLRQTRRAGETSLVLFDSIWSKENTLVDCVTSNNQVATKSYVSKCWESEGRQFSKSPDVRFNISELVEPAGPCMSMGHLARLRAFVRRSRDLESVDQQNSGESSGLKLRRSKRAWIIPGTLWCGAGHSALNFSDLGMYEKTDMCCREHDHCKDSISSFEFNYGVFNTNIFTLSHCDCDEKFRRCLHKANDSMSNVVGYGYFNILKMRCFEFSQRMECAERTWWGMCKIHQLAKYALVKDATYYNSTSPELEEDTQSLSTLFAASTAEPTVTTGSASTLFIEDAQAEQTELHGETTDSPQTSPEKEFTDSPLTKPADSTQTKPKESTQPKATDSAQPKPTDSKPTDLPQTKATNLPQINTTDSTQTEATDLKATDSPQTKATDSSQTKTTDSPQTKATDSPQTKATDSSQTKTTDSPQTKATDSPQTKTTDSPQTKPTGSKPTNSTQPKSTDSTQPKATDSKPTDSTQTKTTNSTQTKPTDSKSTDSPQTNTTDSTPTDSTQPKSTDLKPTDSPQTKATDTPQTKPTDSTQTTSIDSTQTKTTESTQTSGTPKTHLQPYLHTRERGKVLTCESYKDLDSCRHQIPGMQEKFGLRNTEFATLYHCNCTARLAKEFTRLDKLDDVHFFLLDFVSQFCFILPLNCTETESCSGSFRETPLIKRWNKDMAGGRPLVASKRKAKRFNSKRSKRKDSFRLYKKCLRMHSKLQKPKAPREKLQDPGAAASL